LDPQTGEAAATQGQKGLAWLDEGYWLLPPLLLLGLFAFRRNGVAAVLVLGLALPLASPAHAADSDWWRRADQQQHARVERGAQAYRKGDFASAEKAFSDMQGADGAYNRGNALAKQGRYDEAIAAYDEALKLRPGMDDAIANKKAVEAAKKRRQQNGQGKDKQQNPGGQGNQQPNSQQQDSRQQKSGQQQDKSAQRGQQGGQESQSPSNSGDQSPRGSPNRAQQNGSSEQPADARTRAGNEKAQREADAAQKQRMQQAMARTAKPGEKKDANGKAVAPAETAEQRERRQAVEAWLRRVPDDPGGLLRAKFRLEYERRQREER
ncbi:MAG TPA: tetratricopeptide repeat protein, partial [Pseudoxanthomonas sp.]|nr:tetratricopeptide repeat protein [Pseudoxanthomonas sp.]